MQSAAQFREDPLLKATKALLIGCIRPVIQLEPKPIIEYAVYREAAVHLPTEPGVAMSSL